MKQKAEDDWILLGDRCSKYFYKLMKAKHNLLGILEVEDEQGIVHKG